MQLSRSLSIAFDVCRSLPVSHAMSAERSQCLTRCLQSATDRCRCLTRCLQSATDRCRCLTRCLQSATDRCRCLTRCLQSATDRCRRLQIAANVDRYVNPWPVGLMPGRSAASTRQDRLGRGLEASKPTCPQAVVRRRYQRVAENTADREDRFNWFAEKHASPGNQSLFTALLGIRDLRQLGRSVGKTLACVGITLARRGKSQGFVC